jgi:Family of unknown function (DUF6600)/FecR protein
MSIRKASMYLVVLTALVCWLLAVPSFADSQVRIVRLSDVEGNVQIDRNTGQGYEKAFLNLPITQGVKLRAKNDGRAEIEFENGSTLRIIPGTVIEFAELSLRDSGGKVTAVKLQEGTAYVNFNGGKDDEFTLSFGREKTVLTHSVHLRVAMGDTDATLAVFKGDVEVAGPSGTVQVGKKQTATFDLAAQDKYTLAKNLEKDPYDAWDKQQEDYHQRYLSSSYTNYSPYAYGMSDLNYYGNYFNVPGYGMMWQPYFTGVGWDPFMNGSWVWYPGFGYTWVSSYPWGWTPYRYGSWQYVPNYGWAWQPGGSRMAWNTVPRVINPPRQFIPPQAPTSAHNTIMVHRGPFLTPAGSAIVGAGNKVVIHDDSAGLGIPRGSIRNLGKVSQQVRQQGSATTTMDTMPVRTSAVTSAPPAAQGSSVSGSSASRTAAPASRVSTPRMSTPASRSTPAPRSAPAPHTTTPHK